MPEIGSSFAASAFLRAPGGPPSGLSAAANTSDQNNPTSTNKPAQGVEGQTKDVTTPSGAVSNGRQDSIAATSRPHEASDGPNANDNTEDTASKDELTKEQEAQVRELKQRDAEVRAHEQAHAAVGGSYASAPSYTYTKGPDGKKYAVGGQVQIDTSPERLPEATIRKMDIVVRAALAPAEPSPQDRAVARQAQQLRTDAQQQLLQQREAERQAERDERAASADAREGGGSGLPSPLELQIMGPEEAQRAEQDAAQAAQSTTAQAAAAQAYSVAAQLFGG